MATINPMIPIVQKAANVCAYCRSRKQGCDRILPRCSRCAAKGRDCDYTPVHDPPSRGEHGENVYVPLIVYNECGPDLSPRGRNELLRLSVDCFTFNNVAQAKFSSFVAEILDLWEMSIPTLMDEYAAAIQPWLPVLYQHLDWKQEFSGGIARRDRLPSPLLLVATLLVTRRPCSHAEHNGTNLLYVTIRQVLARLQTLSFMPLELIQAGLLVAAYEIGQGLATQAHLTLRTCYATLSLIDFDAKRRNVQDVVESEVPYLRSSILIMDRMIACSTLEYDIPIACSSFAACSRSLEADHSYTVPPKPEPYIKGGPWKRAVMAQVALLAGRVTEYIQSLRYGIQTSETFTPLDKEMSSLVGQLMATNHQHSWYMCDAIALALMSLLALHQGQVLFGDPENSTRARLALLVSAQMAWDMCQSTIGMVLGENVIEYPLAGLAFVFRAGVMAIETMEDAARPDKIEQLLPALRWFEARWPLGMGYVRQLEMMSNHQPGGPMEH